MFKKKNNRHSPAITFPDLVSTEPVYAEPGSRRVGKWQSRSFLEMLDRADRKSLQRVVDDIFIKLEDRIAKTLRQTRRALGQRQTSNVELLALHRQLIPIKDQLIVPTHERIIVHLWPHELPGLEERTAAQSYLHQWYACLEAQALHDGV